MQTAPVTMHGSTQSVELPEGFHLEGNEVYVKHLGKSVLLIPKNADPWDLMADSLGQFTEDYMLDRSQPPELIAAVVTDNTGSMAVNIQ